MWRSRRWYPVLPFATVTMLAASVMLATTSASAVGVSYVVTTTADTSDGRCDTHCSVREAILAANAHPGADMVRVPAGTYILRIPGSGETAGATGDLDITDPVALVGAGERRTVLDGGGIDRVLGVFGGPTSISGLTIRHGLAPNRSGGGGGIRVEAPAVTLTDVTVTANSTVEGITGDSQGGGISAGLLADEINLTLTRVTITSNRARYGAGIAIDTGGAALAHVTISGNTATGAGGAVYNNDSLTTIADGVIRNNRARDGGGAFFNTGDVRDGLPGLLQLTRVEANVNSTPGRGGGLWNLDGGIVSITDTAFARNRAGIGAVALNADQLDIVNSTLSGNASATGGVLVNRGRDPQDMFATAGTGNLRNVTFASNSAGVQNLPLSGPETITNTILSNRGPNCTRTANAGAITSKGGNLDSGRTCAFAATGDRSDVNPMLAGLENNGGPTLTRALRAASRARDAALDAACPSHDQRGVHRPRGPHCDIGAFEAAPVAPGR
jgi:CSLREA domain-containing protein